MWRNTRKSKVIRRTPETTVQRIPTPETTVRRVIHRTRVSGLSQTSRLGGRQFSAAFSAAFA
jgi:hypothetical protein